MAHSRSPSRRRALALALLAAPAAACGRMVVEGETGAAGPSGTAGVGKERATVTGTPGTPIPGAPGGGGGAVVPPAAQAAVEAALADAAGRLGVARAQLRVERVEAREWSDASLGCPQPGMMYAQVITPGFLIVVAGGGRQVEYHADTRGRAVTC